jgi:hypothetical protein
MEMSIGSWWSKAFHVTMGRESQKLVKREREGALAW